MRRVNALARRVMDADGRGFDASAGAAEDSRDASGSSLAGRTDALGGAMRQMDALASRVMSAGAPRAPARTASIEVPQGAGAAPEPRVHAPAPPADPFAAWGTPAERAGGRTESTASHGAGPAPEPAAGNPFAARPAPFAPDPAARALTRSRTDALTHSPPDALAWSAWDADAAAGPVLDPDALASLVNDALVEQARLNGVDLS
ncbi:MAG TPA: hypothetical protein VFR37_09855 [Longimicrobium sp.]|nr:hypothetical protein [Longimicrobium sp.]